MKSRKPTTKPIQIYAGVSKKKAIKVTLKDCIMALTESEALKMTQGRLGDDSGSWIQVRKKIPTGVIDVEISFDPENDNNITSIKIWESKYILDEENEKQIA